MDSLTLPPRWRPGSRIAALTLSWGGPAEYPLQFEQGVRQFEDAFGVEVVELPHTRAEESFLQAHPEARVADLHQALTDDAIDGIVSTIGGDDSIRLLPMLDLDLIHEHPKALLGFSDTTNALLAFLRAGVVGFYGPSLMAGFGEPGGMHDLTVEGVRRMLFTDGAPGEWPVNVEGWTDTIGDWGDAASRATPRPLTPTDGWRWHGPAAVVEGPCIPGCIEILDWVRGSDWMPDLDGAVLAIEASEEAITTEGIQRFLRPLALRGDLDRIGALLVGRPCNVDPTTHAAYDDVITQVVHGEAGRPDLPIVTNLDFGHTTPVWTLPVGGAVRVDGVSRSITFPSPVTSPPRS